MLRELSAIRVSLLPNINLKMSSAEPHSSIILVIDHAMFGVHVSSIGG